jgi:hypothetical protein
MEEVLVTTGMHPGLGYYEWQFTKDEGKRIRDILKDSASQEKIERFIYLLQGLCGPKKMLLSQPSRSKVRLTRERILTDCNAALGHLRQIGNLRITTWYDETIDSFWSYKPEEKRICPACGHPFTTSVNREKCVQCDPSPVKAPDKYEESYLVQQMDSAVEAFLPLKKFIEVIEKYHKAEGKKTGRKKANNDHFIEKVKDIYIEYIGVPTAYEDGPFFELVQAVLEALGLPCKDPSRVIKEALGKT